MVEIKLRGFIRDKNTHSHQEIDEGRGWVEWRILDLVDKNMANPEWFYVAACNQYYFDKKIGLPEGATNGYYIQDIFDESQLLEFATQKFSRLTFSDWDDFYEKMSHEFVYEDSETESN